MADYCGVINVYKEKGYTSHDVVAIVRKALGRVKTGHTGTLDPEAEGVLPICIGKATKIADYLAANTKEYRAVVCLGATTDTLDFTGNVLTQHAVTVTPSDIVAAVQTFAGEQLQTPPMYSAIKINGQKLYDLARKGVEVTRKQRQINIFSIQIANHLPDNQFVIDVCCSKGTYIRSLCQDIGEKLGCGAHMGTLLRTRSGVFELAHSHKLDTIKQLAQQGTIDQLILPIEQVLTGYPTATAPAFIDKLLYNGNPINTNVIEQVDFTQLDTNSLLLVYDHQARLVGLYGLHQKDEGLFLKPKTMLT